MMIASCGTERMKELEQRLADAELALSKAVKAAEFFSSHADCRTDRWGCRCGFCRDTESSKNLREAREYMSKHKGGKDGKISSN